MFAKDITCYLTLYSIARRVGECQIFIAMYSKLVTLMSCVLALGVSESVEAVSKIHRIYAAPAVTSEVKYIQSLRKSFNVEVNTTEALPASVDHSKSIYFPPVIDQSGSSCAQAAGIGYMFTYEMNRLLGRDASVSAANRFSYQFSWNMLNNGRDQGSYVEEGLYLAQRYGMMTEEDYGSSSSSMFRWVTGYEHYLNALRYRTSEIITIADSVPLIKRYLYDYGKAQEPGGVLTFTMRNGGWAFDNNYSGPSSTGYHCMLTRVGSEGLHAMTIAGYDDQVVYTDESGYKHHRAFIVVNTYGKESHDNGRFYLPYDFFRKPSSQTHISENLVGVAVSAYTPKIVFKINMSYSSRRDLSFSVGGSDSRTATRPSQFYSSCAFCNNGGDYPMQGNGQNGSFEFAIDFSNHSLSNGADFHRFFLNVVRSTSGAKGSGTVNNVEVIDYRTTTPRVYKSTLTAASEIRAGENIFSIPVGARFTISASPFKFAVATRATAANVFLVRTANGRHAKMQLAYYNQSTGQMSLNYSLLNS